MAGLSKPRWWGYSLGNVGVSVGLMPLNLLLLYYLTEVAGLPAALAGVAIALPKAWDALVDPAFGGWVDRVSMRIGRRSPAILGATVVFGLTLTATFSLPQHADPMVTFALVTMLLIASSTAQTAIGVSQYALAIEMTHTPVELSSLLALATILAQIVGVAGSAIVPLLVSSAGTEAAGYSRMAIEVATAAAFMLAIFARTTRTIPLSSQSAEASSLSLWASLKATTHNHIFYRTVGLVVCLNASIAIQIGFVPFANQYVLHGGPDTLALLEGELGATVLAGMVVAPLLVRRLPIISAMQLCNLAVAVALCGLFLAGFGPFWVSAAVLIPIGLGSGVIGVLIQTAILEAARLRLPGRAALAMGFYLGVMIAGTKLGSSAGAVVSGEVLALFGFQAHNPAQTGLALSGLRLGYTLVPLVFVLMGSLCIFGARLPVSNVSHGDD